MAETWLPPGFTAAKLTQAQRAFESVLGAGKVFFEELDRTSYQDKFAIDDALHLLLMPVASVAEQHLRNIGDAGRREFALRGVEHRFQMPEVGRNGHDLGGDHDLVLVGDGLGVVALQEPATA